MEIVIAVAGYYSCDHLHTHRNSNGESTLEISNCPCRCRSLLLRPPVYPSKFLWRIHVGIFKLPRLSSRGRRQQYYFALAASKIPDVAKAKFL